VSAGVDALRPDGLEVDARTKEPRLGVDRSLGLRAFECDVEVGGLEHVLRALGDDRHAVGPRQALAKLVGDHGPARAGSEDHDALRALTFGLLTHGAVVPAHGVSAPS
jgi:hypothetical protein